MVNARFDDLIHAPLRLRICAALDTASDIEFAALEKLLDVTTPNLSKQLKLLTDAGYVRLDKRRQAVGRPRTWVALTATGRRAYRGHVRALQELIAPTPGANAPGTE